MKYVPSEKLNFRLNFKMNITVIKIIISSNSNVIIITVVDIIISSITK